MMRGFRYSDALAADFPGLSSLVCMVDGISAEPVVSDTVERNLAIAREQLQRHGSESQLESVRHWRAAYRKTGVDPTKFRMAAESILRRLRASDAFTTGLHPFVTLCNALSARFAVPVAGLDIDRIDGRLEVGYASGRSEYDGFDGVVSVVPAGEVTFEDEANRAHARKWSHRQSGLSAISPSTTRAFVIAEALHPEGERDLLALSEALSYAIHTHWPGATCASRMLAGDALTAGFSYP
ncbi:B3/B4 domain-containing protein [Burkholderia ubonensis]|uniref:B3/B4 tRNA-binding domain-containing protein n=1 Tax=Burkholderia ubonensis subsp. mesacidophila TaxID=265293 RepID=A0A2A4FAN8_9BURK|nr:phenylalanine--tRNA ligase beta subunit-related protein [Burkholderia ubonensis]PCE30205.1 hypothetical protein BZL54_22420 [Burkholderia ubonensis subsp. mesacidophila]